MYACLNSQNKSSVSIGAGSKKRAGLAAKCTESKTRGMSASETGMVAESANKRVELPKFALEELDLLKRVYLLESLVDRLESFWAHLQATL